jgi:hypothetical protein
MNLPPGTMLKTGLETSSVSLPALVKELMKKKFNGYLAVVIPGLGGVEEGILIFDDGRVVASSYEYLFYHKLMLGKDAFARVMNASSSKNGVIDVVELTNEQVHLLLAFTEAAIYVPTDAEINAPPKEFTYDLEIAMRSNQMPQTREQLLKKYKLGEAAANAKEDEIKLKEDTSNETDLLRSLTEETRTQQELRQRIRTV